MKSLHLKANDSSLKMKQAFIPGQELIVLKEQKETRKFDRLSSNLIANDSLNLCHMVIVQRQSYHLLEGVSKTN